MPFHFQANPCVKVGSKATMGYKGITTEYLPRTTVPLKTVEIPGCRCDVLDTVS